MTSYDARTIAVTLAAVLVTTACGRDDDAAPSDTAAVVATRDALMAGGPRRGPSRDADHEFLRAMSDHHQGLVVMADAAMSRGSSEQVRDDAQLLHMKQEREMREMVDLIQSTYGESIDPIATQAHRAMNDSLQAMSGTGYDRTFYRMVAQHHREGLRMMDEFRPRVQRPGVQQMIDRMRADHEREIRELERKRA
jgi:uncharacterized protein (DUF305 family)